MTIFLNTHKANFFTTNNKVSLITNVHEVQHNLSQYSIETVSNLMNVNRGPEGGRMQTLGLLKAVKSSQTFIINETGIYNSDELFAIDLENEATNPSYICTPKYLEFNAKWDNKVIEKGEGNNILGD